MTKQEQIEEMAKEFEDIAVYQDNECCKCKKYEYNECEDECFTKKSAEYFYNLGYRKIPEATVLLIGKHNQPLDEETIEYFVDHNQEVRKETAKEILDYFDRYAGTGEKLIGNIISEQRKKYGIEVEE